MPFTTRARFQRTPPDLHDTAYASHVNAGQGTGRKRSKTAFKHFLSAPTKAELLASVPPHIPPQCQRPAAPCARQARARGSGMPGSLPAPATCPAPSSHPLSPPTKQPASRPRGGRHSQPRGSPGSGHPASGTRLRRTPFAPLPARGTGRGCVNEQDPKEQLEAELLGTAAFPQPAREGGDSEKMKRGMRQALGERRPCLDHSFAAIGDAAGSVCFWQGRWQANRAQGTTSGWAGSRKGELCREAAPQTVI